jgi:hypothetical protein
MVDRKLAKRTRKQNNVAHALLHVLTQEKLDAVTDAIDKARADEREFNILLQQYPLNLNILMSSDEAGEVARSSFEQGYIKGVLKRG